MKSVCLMIVMLAFAGLLLPGCAAREGLVGGGQDALSESEAHGVVQDTATEARSDRMLTWTADLDIKVADVKEGMRQAVAVAERYKGYVENKRDRGEKSAWVRLRIPSAAFKDAVGALEQLGEVSSRSLRSEDVTEQYVDVEARLKNKKELRDRLRQLLQKATSVKDIVMIETELNRVQSDIDAMEAKIRSLRSRVGHATVDVNLERKRILGPLGYLLEGIWWGIEKLFILRD